MTTIIVPMTVESTNVVESYEDGKRYRWTVSKMRKSDGTAHVHTHCEEIPDEGPLLFIPDGPDVDDIARRDLTQWAKEKPRVKRERPDMQKMYREFNERRLRELDTKTTHPVAKVEHGH